MRKFTKTLRWTLACAFLLGMGSAAPFQAPEPAKAPAPANVSEPAKASGSAYVGSDTCNACHDEIYTKFSKSPHFAIESDKHRGFEHQSCEACHGPGAKHAESASPADIRNPAKLESKAVDKICLGCHLNQRTSFGRIAGGHAKDEVGCNTCHSIHGGDGRKLVNRNAADITKQCAGCHPSEWAAFQRPYKHRLPEGAMSCADCHNPHASFRPEAMRSSFGGNEPGCLGCHSDKRGPFPFEHAPVRLEGCQACHEPHGSANPRMLTRHVEYLTCLECHANLPIRNTAGLSGKLGVVPPSFHDLRSPRYQNCTVCHVKIHGSYVDRTLQR
jgi:DmsE family decaheme c-type cytochrome